MARPLVAAIALLCAAYALAARADISIYMKYAAISGESSGSDSGALNAQSVHWLRPPSATISGGGAGSGTRSGAGAALGEVEIVMLGSPETSRIEQAAHNPKALQTVTLNFAHVGQPLVVETLSDVKVVGTRTEERAGKVVSVVTLSYGTRRTEQGAVVRDKALGPARPVAADGSLGGEVK